MLVDFRKSLARLISPEQQAEIEMLQKSTLNFDHKVNVRVSEIINKMDPYEPIFRKFKGVFSEEFPHPEDKLDDAGKLAMMFYGYMQAQDPCHKYVVDWIINTQANDTLKRAPVTEERIMYGRAQISGMILYRDEIKRLANAYADYMDKQKPKDLDETNTVDG